MSLLGHGESEGEEEHDEKECHEAKCPGDDVDLSL